MKNRKFIKTIFFFFFVILLQNCSEQVNSDNFSFIVLSDHRDHATEEFHSKEYTLGGFEAIKNVGQGEFVVINGDLDPPQDTRALLDEVLGEDYPWYTVIGNHDAETEEDMEFLRDMNRNGNSFANIVRRGPAGCEETTYSFDYNNVHIVVLNLYYDGEKDNLADGVVTPKLLAWLEEDLKQNDKKYTFVFGHEPIRPVMDLVTGAVRHLGDSMDQYYEETVLFERLLHKYNVNAFFSGHTHCASYANRNGLWLINSGHIYGQETAYTPDKTMTKISAEISKEENRDKSYKDVIKEMYYKDYDSHKRWKQYKKLIFNFGFGDGWNYKNMPDDVTLAKLNEFYAACKDNDEEMKKYQQLFWDNTEWRKSTFLKIKIENNYPVVEYYRDKDYYGNYELTQTITLN
jgi:predicted phosphodiesterase